MIEGSKFDGAKARYDLIPPNALDLVARVLEFGARKYAPENWRKVPDARRRYFAAVQRHLWAWWRGQANDSESGLPHIAHALCCAFFILELETEQRDHDAPKKED